MSPIAPREGASAVRRRVEPETVGLVALAAVALTLSWRRWPDLLVDFGQQLYVPWRLALGDRLHRDIWFLHGPLSQHVDAALFRLFGASYTVLIVADIAVAAAAAAALHRLARRSGGRVAAAAAAALFIGLFACAQYVWHGNYNWIGPYTHEATHGTALALAMTLALARWIDSGGTGRAALAGLCLGLALLTKVDVAAAAAATAACALVLAALLPGPAARGGGRAAFLAAAAAPPAGFVLYFATYLPPGAALRAAAAGFASLSSDVARNRFYQHVLGLDDPAGHLAAMGRMTTLAIAAAAAAAAADLLAARFAGAPRRVAAAAGVALFAGLVLWPEIVPWMELPRALPPLVGALAGGLLWDLARRRADAAERRRLVPLLLLAILGAGMVAKVALNVHLFHYGFYLALPATIACAVAALGWAPRRLAARGGTGTLFSAAALAVAAAAVVYHLRWSEALYGRKDLAVGRGGDVILTFGAADDETGAITRQALDWVEANTAPDATLVGLPEGIMINYLTRRATTTPCMNFMMTEMILFGEDRLVSDLEAHPPDYVLLVHKDTREFGVGPFGADPRYGKRILDWVRDRYRPVARFGAEPFRGEKFGIAVLRRGAAAEGAADRQPEPAGDR